MTHIYMYVYTCTTFGKFYLFSWVFPLQGDYSPSSDHRLDYASESEDINNNPDSKQYTRRDNKKVRLAEVRLAAREYHFSSLCFINGPSIV